MALQPQIQARKAVQKSIQWADIKADNPALNTRSENLDKGIVEGYGVIWGSKNSYDEIYVRGAFTKSILENGPQSDSAFKIKFRHEHKETVSVIAELREDEIGLYFRTAPLDMEDDLNQEIIRKLKNGTYNNFSIGFGFVWNAMVWDDDKAAYLMYEVKLWEISVVGIPSDQNTYAIRTAEDISELFTQTESFIASLPKAKRLAARSVFAEYQTLIENRPPVTDTRKAPDENEDKPADKVLDLSYIADNF